MNLLGVPLPVTVVVEKWRFYEAVPTARTAAEAENPGPHGVGVLHAGN